MENKNVHSKNEKTLAMKWTPDIVYDDTFSYRFGVKPFDATILLAGQAMPVEKIKETSTRQFEAIAEASKNKKKEG